MVSSTDTFGTAYGRFAAPSTEVASTPFFTMNASNGVPARIDWPTIRWRQPTSLPSAVSPASSLWKYIGR